MLFPLGKDNVKVRFGTLHSFLLGEYFKHLGCYEVNYSNNRDILFFNIGRDRRACRKTKKEVTLKCY